MNPEDEKFVQSLNCWEDNYDVITDNIQKLSGLLSLQIQLLQNVQEEKEHQRNVRHMTLEEQSISRMLNSFEQQISIKLNELKEVMKIDGEDKVEVRSVTFSVEEKLDKVVELLEKLVPKPISLRQTPINAASKEYIDRLVEKIRIDSEKVKEPGKEEFIKRVNEIDWTKIPGAKISLLNEKGKDIGVKCDIKEDGSVVCEPVKEEFNDRRPKVLVEDEKKRKSSIFTPDGKQFWVFKKKGEKFVKVGTAEINQDVVRITFLNDYKKEYIDNPSSYEYGFWTMTDYGGSSWLGYSKNLLESYQFKYNFTEIEGSHAVTGYLTEQGKVVYYDQYL